MDTNFPNVPIAAKSVASRMEKGKGALSHLAAQIIPSMFKQIKFSKIKEFVTNQKQKKNNFSSETQSSNSNNQSNLIREYFTKKTLKELNKMAKEAEILVRRKERNKANLVSILTKKCVEQPTLLDKLKIDLYKHRVIEQLPVVINPEAIALVSVTQDSYFCLEDIFSIQGWDFKKTSSQDWQRTQSFTDYLDAASIRTKIDKKDLIVKEQSGKTFVHRLIAIEAARYRSPSLSVAFNEIVDEFFSKTVAPTEQQHSPVVLSETLIKAHPLYKMLLTENENLKQLNTTAVKTFYKFGKEKPANYAVFFPASKIYKQGECLNIDKTLATYRRVDVNVKVVVLLYHNKVSNDRFEFESCIYRKFSKYHIGNEQYGKGLNSITISSIWEEIINGAGFDVTWESKSKIDKYNTKG